MFKHVKIKSVVEFSHYPDALEQAEITEALTRALIRWDKSEVVIRCVHQNFTFEDVTE